VDAVVRLSRSSARRALLALALAAGCATVAPPVVTTQLFGTAPGIMRKVAVVPFEPDRKLDRGGDPTAVSASVAAELVTRFVAEALAREGSAVVAPNDLVIAFEAKGLPLPRGDARTVAALAAEQFGASAIVLGRVQRYREREGSAGGALRPASVAFDLELYTAPAGEKIYMAHFDHTQATLTGDLFGALRYPGGGSRWLSAAELGSWGAENAVKEVPGGLR
jgi:hypothetical protein